MCIRDSCGVACSGHISTGATVWAPCELGRPGSGGASAFASLGPVARSYVEHDRSPARASPALGGAAAVVSSDDEDLA
eukprot:9887787-Alexandrium_andersonii.AAC.1